MCPKCGGWLTTDEDWSGRWVTCLMCGSSQLVSAYRGPDLMYVLGANHCWTGQVLNRPVFVGGSDDSHSAYYKWRLTSIGQVAKRRALIEE